MKVQKTESHSFQTESAEPNVYLNTYSKKYDLEFRNTDERGNQISVELIVPISQAVELAESILERNRKYLESLAEEKESVDDD